jgi:hypothetical protein
MDKEELFQIMAASGAATLAVFLFGFWAGAGFPA